MDLAKVFRVIDSLFIARFVVGRYFIVIDYHPYDSLPWNRRGHSHVHASIRNMRRMYIEATMFHSKRRTGKTKPLHTFICE